MGLRMLSGELPAGFHQADSGLALPAELTRIREVLLWDEWRTIDRAAKILQSHKVRMTLTCGHEGCDGAIEQVYGVDNPTLQCQCRSRIFARDL